METIEDLATALISNDYDKECQLSCGKDEWGKDGHAASCPFAMAYRLTPEAPLPLQTASGATDCGHTVKCTEVCADCKRCQDCCTCRVRQTIDRLISNLPDTIALLRGYGFTSLARQLKNDLDNLIYWQANGGLIEVDNE